MTAEAFAPAKINLTLQVTGQRADGYHLLDSLVVFGDVGDHLRLVPADDLSLTVTGPFADGVPTDRRNLVWQAAELAGWTGHIALEKNIPNGAGLGGGSADAAALLRNLFGDRHSDGVGLEAALALGADVPVCLSAVPQRMRGIGEDLARVWPVPECHLVLVHPGVAASTPRVFQALASRKNPPMEQVSGWSDALDFLEWLGRQRNDLQSAACEVVPVIATCLDALSDALLARMSGSGSACFGIYADTQASKNAAARIKADHPDWWVATARTVGHSS